MPKPPPAGSPFWKLWELAVATPNRLLFRATGGRVGGSIGRAPVLLLHHVGRRTGEKRVSPLFYLQDGDRLVVVASKGGIDRHPAWFHNLMATPDTEVELPREGRRTVRARRATPDEAADLWPRLDELYKPYADYRSWTDREIPLVVLE